METYYYILIVLVGLALGSFFNVVVCFHNLILFYLLVIIKISSLGEILIEVIEV